MWRTFLFHQRFSRTNIRRRLSQSCVDIAPEISTALRSQKPVVALESAIITHGMPQPYNLQTAFQAQAVIREQGAVPATIAVVNGRVKVGLTDLELEKLSVADKNTTKKTSRRDFPFVISKGFNGGTTVAGTIMVAHAVGIKVFATGGLGGVHRGAEDTWDVSADLVELGRTPVAVVCSGAKSILDIPRTLEYLETQGVCVATLGPDPDFPAFYTRSSGCMSPCHVTNISEAAELAVSWWRVASPSGAGLVIAVPVPQSAAANSQGMEEAIRTAVAEAEKQGITGRDLTPFLLSKVNQITAGTALETNISLVLNNAMTAAQICVEMNKRDAYPPKCAAQSKSLHQVPNTGSSVAGGVVIVGGSALDRVVKTEKSIIELDGQTWRGRISECAGGVGRNLAEAVGRLQRAASTSSPRPPPLFVSAVGQDRAARFLLEQLAQTVDVRGVLQSNEANTTAYEVLLDGRGECRLVVGDVAVDNTITKQWAKNFEEDLIKSSLVLIDGNIPDETMHFVLKSCNQAGVPVWFEPTDPNKASTPIRSILWNTLSIISPNFRELQMISSAAGAKVFDVNSADTEGVLEESLRLARYLVSQGIGTVLVTLGSLGAMVVRRGGAEDPLSACTVAGAPALSARLYAAPVLAQKSLNVSGAGDCFAAAVAVGFTRELGEARAISWGLAAAACSLQSPLAIPETLDHLTPPQSDAPFSNLMP